MSHPSPHDSLQHIRRVDLWVHELRRNSVECQWVAVTPGGHSDTLLISRFGCAVNGNPVQNKFRSIRKNSGFFMILLLSNMIANKTLPVIVDPVLGRGLYGIVVGTVLIVL